MTYAFNAVWPDARGRNRVSGQTAASAECTWAHPSLASILSALRPSPLCPPESACRSCVTSSRIASPCNEAARWRSAVPYAKGLSQQSLRGTNTPVRPCRSFPLRPTRHRSHRPIKYMVWPRMCAGVTTLGTHRYSSMPIRAERPVVSIYIPVSRKSIHTVSKCVLLVHIWTCCKVNSDQPSAADVAGMAADGQSSYISCTCKQPERAVLRRDSIFISETCRYQ